MSVLQMLIKTHMGEQTQKILEVKICTRDKNIKKYIGQIFSVA